MRRWPGLASPHRAGAAVLRVFLKRLLRTRTTEPRRGRAGVLLPRPGTRAGLFALLLIGPLAAQESVIRVLVSVLATVRDASGQLAAGLAKGDFRILSDGVEQEIAVFERQTAQPLSVALLVDASGSTAKDLKVEIQAVSRFLGSLLGEGNPRDTVAFYSFNYEVARHTGFTRNRSSVERALKMLKGEAGTAVYDALYLASRDLEDRDGRHVIVLVTDGGDTVSQLDFHAALKAVQTADAVIYPVLVMPITSDAGRNIGGENALTNLAAGTGGKVSLATSGELDAAFADIISSLRTQYLLGFYPRNVPLASNRFHRLEVRTARPGLRVSARSGYYPTFPF